MRRLKERSMEMWDFPGHASVFSKGPKGRDDLRRACRVQGNHARKCIETEQNLGLHPLRHTKRLCPPPCLR